MLKLLKIIFIEIVVTFILAEIVFRLVLPNYPVYKRTQPGEDRNYYSIYFEPEKDLGWALRKNTTLYGLNGISYNSNRQGFRDDMDFVSQSVSLNKKRIMLLGDSFQFGYFINEDQTCARLLEKKLGDNYQIFNLGMVGYGIDQMYLAYKKYETVIKPDIVILTFIDEDIVRGFESFRSNEGMTKPSFAIKDNKLVLRNFSDPPFFRNIIGSSRVINWFYKQFYRWHYCKMITNLIFADMAKSARNENQELIIIRYPMLTTFGNDSISKLNYCFLTKYFSYKSIIQGEKLVYLDLYDKIAALSKDQREELYLKDDVGYHHPSENGNNFISDCICKIISSVN
jgi:hypothetical protein